MRPALRAPFRGRRIVAFALALIALGSGGTATAAAAPTEMTIRYGPIDLGAFEVDERDYVYGVPRPPGDIWVTSMDARVVDARGKEVPLRRVMLHHVGFANAGGRVGERRDPTCKDFLLWDSRTRVPATSERFFAIGEEATVGALPEGYGYPVRADDDWAIGWMLMNHRPTVERVWIEYTVGYDTAPLTDTQPIWLDVRNCRLDPIFDVPGGGPPGSTFSESTTWRAPTSGRIVSAISHIHGGGRRLTLTRPGCADQLLVDPRLVWGFRDDPVYNIRPLLHEPGPVSIGVMRSVQGIPVAAGEELKLTATYDNELPHTRVMGIMGIAFVPDESVTAPCGPIPDDIELIDRVERGRARSPLMRLPLNAYAAGGGTKTIRRPPGARVMVPGRRPALDVKDSYFVPANAVVRRGSQVRWNFLGSSLHNVTLASGPEGFSSANLDDARVYEKRLRRRGTYRLFCTLHPLSMTQTVRVVGTGRDRR